MLPVSTNQPFDKSSVWSCIRFQFASFSSLTLTLTHTLGNRHCHKMLNSNKIAPSSKHKANMFTATNKETDFKLFLFFCSLQTENFNSMSWWQIFGNLFADFRFPRKYGHFIRFILQTHTMQHSSYLPCYSRYVANFRYFIVLLCIYKYLHCPALLLFVFELILICNKNINETHFWRGKNAVSL